MRRPLVSAATPSLHWESLADKRHRGGTGSHINEAVRKSGAHARIAFAQSTNTGDETQRVRLSPRRARLDNNRFSV